jgi:hypothetical protein
MINSYEILVRKPERKRPLRTPASRWEDSINKLIYFFICSLFNDVASSSDFTVSNDMILMNWKGYRRKQSWPNLRYYPGICMLGQRKTTKNVSQDSQSPGQDLNLGSLEYKARMLTTQPQHSIRKILRGNSVRVSTGLI